MVEDFPPAQTDGESEENGESEESAAPAVEGEEDGEGARRWRGRRRRRGGRRGRGDEKVDRPEPKVEAAKPEEPAFAPAAPIVEARPEPRQEPRTEFRQERPAPPRYAPMVLPGESISKYRNMPAPSEPQTVVATEHYDKPDHEPWSTPVEQHVAAAPWTESQETHDRYAEATHAAPQTGETQEHFSEEHGHVATEPEQLERAAAGLTHASPMHEEATAPQAATTIEATRETVEPHAVAAAHEDDNARRDSHSVAELAAEQQDSPFLAARDRGTEHAETEHYASSAALNDQPESHVHPTAFAESDHEQHDAQFDETESATEYPVARETMNFVQHTAPSVAPEGRTLEHEVLEDDEMEFHPVPENLEALSEVAGDEELVLEEETMDRGADDYNGRWVPKIADVDEDEVIAAEERGENIFEGGNDEEEEEEDETIEEETNGRAEVRAATPVVGYQQRQQQRPSYDRNQRGRRGGSGGGRRNNVRPRPGYSNRPQPLITDLLKEGQEVLIQIAKEPIGKKGARITSHIALPGRFLVYMPTVNHVGVSRKIASDEERQRLKRIVTSERENGLGGFIVRTAAANIKEDELRSDIRFLKHLWAEIKSRAENGKSPALIYHDLNLVERVLRDQVNADFSQIWVDTEDQYERVVRFASRFQPSLVKRIKLYTKDTPLYEQFGIQEEIDRSLKSKVWLKSGGYLVINQTEALVAIDINTGKYVGKTQRLEDTIVKTNVDAVKEIVRQVRLRDLGGIIVIDFIDMDERKNRQKVMQALEEAMRFDRAPSKVLQFNDFGLVAITRKRVKQSLERTLGESCPYCTGAGFVKSVPTVCNELYIEMRKMAKVHDRTDITLRVNPEVAKALKANNGKLITEMEELTNKTVLVKSDPLLHQENFDIH